MDQRQLVERAREGDHDAFAELVRASVARLDTAARLILRDNELARDAVQEGLFRAWRDLRSLRDPDGRVYSLWRRGPSKCSRLRSAGRLIWANPRVAARRTARTGEA